MRTHVSRVVDLPRDRLYAWWTDYGPDDHAKPRIPGVKDTREVVERSNGRVVYEERASLLGLPFRERTRVTMQPPAEVEARSESSLGEYLALFRFEALPMGATRVTYELNVPPGRGLGRVPAPLLSRAARSAMRLDLRYHLKQAERDLAASPSQGEP